MQFSFLRVTVNAATWNRPVYIRANGSIDPSTADITTQDNITYRLTANIDFQNSSGIVIERDNIIIDGYGYTVRRVDAYPTVSTYGINASYRQNLEIKNMTVRDFCWTGYGMWIYNSTNVSIHDCKILHNYMGIEAGPNCSRIRIFKNEFNEANQVALEVSYSNNMYVYKNQILNTAVESVYVSECHNAVIAYNNINGSQAQTGISLYSGDTLILLNQIVSANGGIWYSSSGANNTIARNNFVVGSCAFDAPPSPNNWYFNNNFTKPPAYLGGAIYDPLNNSYPSCGNYWMTYNGTDTDSDGIGNQPYVFCPELTDYLPFMYPFNLTMDVNHDGIVNMRDIALVIAASGSQPGDAKWNWWADVNGDAMINQADIDIVVACFNNRFYAHPKP